MADLRSTATELALLRSSVGESLAQLYPGWPDDHWSTSWIENWEVLGAQGLWSALEPTDGSLSAAAVVAEECGRAMYPGPVVETLVGSHVVGDIAALVDNAAMVAVPAEFPVVIVDGSEFRTGSAADIQWEQAHSIDVSRRFVRSRSAPLRAPITAPVERVGALRRVLYCADSLGCVDRVLHRTVEYARQRRTFGSPIGKYQAVAHRLVDHTLAHRQMRLLIEDAAKAFDHGAADFAHRAALIEAFMWTRASDLISDCIQLCGAIGFTWEFGHHFFLRRVFQNSVAGGGRPHRRLADGYA